MEKNGKVRFGLGYSSKAHAKCVMSNGAFIVPPHEFKNLLRWYYRLWEIKNHENNVV